MSDHEHDDESDDGIYSNLGRAAMGLCMAAAVVGCHLEEESFEATRPGYIDRIREVTNYLDQQAEELTLWGEAFEPEV